jgi:hypothetical protein
MARLHFLNGFVLRRVVTFDSSIGSSVFLLELFQFLGMRSGRIIMRFGQFFVLGFELFIFFPNAGVAYRKLVCQSSIITTEISPESRMLLHIVLADSKSDVVTGRELWDGKELAL